MSAGTTEPIQAGAAAPRIVFGILSAQQPVATVAQLVDALAPHPVWIHHDFTKQSPFELVREHVRFVPQPRVTGWGSWGLVEAIVHMLDTALAQTEFDYFQLLSTSCLPIAPLAAFQDFVRRDPAAVHADLIPVLEDPDWLMSFAYRLFVPAHSWRFRLLRSLRGVYFGAEPELVSRHSLSVLRPRRGPSAALPRAARLAWWLTQQAARGRWGRHPFGAGQPPWIGGLWFGARRAVCESLVKAARAEGVARAFARLHLVDEIFFPSLLAAGGWSRGPSNHVVADFDEHGHPRWLDESDVPQLASSPRFFARKFPVAPDAPIRQWALARARDASGHDAVRPDPS